MKLEGRTFLNFKDDIDKCVLIIYKLGVTIFENGLEYYLPSMIFNNL